MDHVASNEGRNKGVKKIIKNRVRDNGNEQW